VTVAPTANDPTTAEVWGTPRHATGLLTGADGQATLGHGAFAGPRSGETLDHAGLMALAIRDIDRAWQTLFPRLRPQLSYTSPVDYIAYQPGVRPPQATVCWKDSTPQANNAYYCYGEKQIYYDDAFLREVHDEFGDFAPIAIFAHEFGHHIYNLANREPEIDPADYSIQRELQADCYAGVYASWANQAKGDLVLAPDDPQEGSAFFFGRRPNDSPWFKPGNHGTPTQRGLTFQRGLQSGDPTVCLDMEQFKFGPEVTVAPYVLAFLEGTTVESLPNATSRVHLPGTTDAFTADVRGLRDLGSSSALAQLCDVATAYAPETAIQPVFAPEDLTSWMKQSYPLVSRGEIAGVAYEQDVDPGPATDWVHGYLLLHVTGVGPGIVVDVYADGAADDADWDAIWRHVTNVLMGLRYDVP
jgi:predicted metalloprotease